ncbi:MAG: DHHA1 domain-containing protein [Candidatus Methanomethylicaceae archaeon]|jgi:RecJ-like exonuclease
MVHWILAHGDTDGICSGAIALAAIKGAKLFFTHPTGLAEDLKQVDGDLTVCDIALPAQGLKEAIEELRRIRDLGASVLYIDHHPIPPGFDQGSFPGEYVNVLRASVSELTFLKYQAMIPSDMNRVAIYGAIGDYLDDTYNVQKWMWDWDKSLLYLESGMLIQAIDTIGRNHDFKREIALSLASNKLPSSDERLVTRAVQESINEEWMRKKMKDLVKVQGNVAYVRDIDWSLSKSAIYSKASAGTLVGIGAETRKDFVDMSLRTHSEAIDLNKALSQVAERVGGSGGGHPMAAGARVPKGKFQQFVQELDSAVSEQLKQKTADY